MPTNALKLFVNYRRADEAQFVETLWTHFIYRYQRDNVFMDFDTLPPFADFANFIRQTVRECDVVVAIIGPRWLDLLKEKEKHGEPDYVRIELEEALKHGKVIAPILIQGAHVPPTADIPVELRPIFAVHLPEIRAGRDLVNNVGWIMDAFEKALRERGVQKTTSPPADPIPTTAGSAPLSLDDLLDRFTDAYVSGDDPQALIWVAELRAHGDVPAGFRLDQKESIVRTRLKAAEERRRRRDVADYQYKFVRRMMRSDDAPEDIRAMLDEVWRQEPDYDPDGIAARLPKPVPPDPAQTAMQRARTFTGVRNKEWQPFIGVFSSLKIADMRFCLVPTGEFQMGSQDGKYSDEEPQHPQRIAAPYWIGQFPVTNAQWARGVAAGAVKQPLESGDSLKWYKDKAMADAPVVAVTWRMARDFAAWMGCRLPSELEWEYAARGVESLRYTWGNDWNPAIPVWKQNSGDKPAAVTSKPEGMSWVGAQHLLGNVWEWTGSRYETYPYTADGSREQDADNRTDVQFVLRGGSWGLNDPGNLRAACRYWVTPDGRHYVRGFRLALS